MDSIKELVQIVLENSEYLEEEIILLNEVLREFIIKGEKATKTLADAIKEECVYLKRCPNCGKDESYFETFTNSVIDVESKQVVMTDVFTTCSNCGNEVDFL
jgi:hypothetical protein